MDERKVTITNAGLHCGNCGKTVQAEYQAQAPAPCGACGYGMAVISTVWHT